jgi:hypothetical protein
MVWERGKMMCGGWTTASGPERGDELAAAWLEWPDAGDGPGRGAPGDCHSSGGGRRCRSGWEGRVSVVDEGLCRGNGRCDCLERASERPGRRERRGAGDTRCLFTLPFQMRTGRAKQHPPLARGGGGLPASVTLQHRTYNPGTAPWQGSRGAPRSPIVTIHPCTVPNRPLNPQKQPGCAKQRGQRQRQNHSARPDPVLPRVGKTSTRRWSSPK